MNKYITEFIGTLFLVLGAAMYGAVGASLSLMVMIYAGGHISGAHYNPAVTLSVMIRGKAKLNEAIGYWIAQLLAAAIAALLVTSVFKHEGAGECIIPDDGII